jgi:hypothetical protein
MNPRVLPILLALGLATLSMPAPAPACDSAGPNTHVGRVIALDRADGALTLKDAETGAALTFRARPELLRGIAPTDEVAVTFAPEGRTLRATSIEKAGN